MIETNMTKLANQVKQDGYVVVTGCKRCGKCDSVCPTEALKKRDGYVFIDYKLCDVCLKCVEVCPNKALIYLE